MNSHTAHPNKHHEHDQHKDQQTHKPQAHTPQSVTLGFDVGTGSSKAVLVDESGAVIDTHVISHQVSNPLPGHFEMNPEIWWQEFTECARELLRRNPGAKVQAVGVSGMGPCVALTDSHGTPVRDAILYGVDTRASAEIVQQRDALGGVDAVLAKCGSDLSSQAVGPKIAWISKHEPENFAKATRLFMPASYLVWQLTGEYTLDHQSASQSVPLYDVASQTWDQDIWRQVCGHLEPPTLRWGDALAGYISPAAAARTGLPALTPVAVGTIDAWAEAISAHAHEPGKLMLMYGSTAFFIATSASQSTHPSLWSNRGVFEGTYCLAGGMATTGSLTTWFANLLKNPSLSDQTQESPAQSHHAQPAKPILSHLFSQAAEVPAGSNGLLCLPYFSGERTPILDPDAKGVIAGLTLSHTQSDIFRAILESVAFGIRHNLEVMKEAGCPVNEIVAVGGGTQSLLWPQIVSDVAGIKQLVPNVNLGASYGMALLAARLIGFGDTATWNREVTAVIPNPELKATYDELYAKFRQLYVATRDLVHTL